MNVKIGLKITENIWI